jgi:hypothetical protein
LKFIPLRISTSNTQEDLGTEIWFFKESIKEGYGRLRERRRKGELPNSLGTPFKNRWLVLEKRLSCVQLQ